MEDRRRGDRAADGHDAAAQPLPRALHAALRRREPVRRNEAAAEPAPRSPRRRARNDVGFGLDDFAGIGIDPSGNGGQVYFFMTTPLGTRYQQSTESARFAPPWTAVAARTARRLERDAGDPAAACCAAPRAVQTWRFDFIRRIAALNVNESWAYDATMNDGGGGVDSFPQAGDARFWPKLTDLRSPATPARRPPRAEVYGARRARARTAAAFRPPTATSSPTGARHVGARLRRPDHRHDGASSPRSRRTSPTSRSISRRSRRKSSAARSPSTGRSSRRARTFSTPSRSSAINAPPNRIFYSPAIGPFDRGLKIEGTQGLQSFGALEAQGAGFDDLVFGYKHATPNRAFSWSLDGVMTHHQAATTRSTRAPATTRRSQAQVGGPQQQDRLRLRAGLRARSGDVRRAARGWRTRAKTSSTSTSTTTRSTPATATSVRSMRRCSASRRTPTCAARRLLRSERNARAERLDQARRPVRHGRPLRRRQRRGAPVRLQRQRRPAVQERAAPLGRAVQSSLRTYDSGLVGYPFYTGGVTRTYDQHSVNLGWKEGTPAPFNAGFSWGPFGDMYLQQVSLSTSRAIGTRWNVGGEIDGTRERPSFGGPRERPVAAPPHASARRSTRTRTSRFAARRSAAPADSRSPASTSPARSTTASRTTASCSSTTAPRRRPTTLQRVVLKYVLRTGGGAGT